MKKLLCLLSSIAAISSCTHKLDIKNIDRYLNADNVETKGRYMAEDFRSYFESKTGKGKTKAEALTSFMNWDGHLHPDVKILHYEKQGNSYTIYLNEQNDFSKPIGYPGWKATMVFILNSKKQIQESIYIPDSTNASYRLYLQPALDWLTKNRPAELSKIYQNNRLVQNQETAVLWRELLKEWKMQNNK